MVKSVALVALGAIGALQAERWLAGVMARLSPRAVTDQLLDRANQRLEQNRPAAQ